jgi:hypothetical protein
VPDSVQPMTRKDPLRRTRLFIASASENLGTAEALQAALDSRGVSSVVWNRAFQFSCTNVENLETIAAQVSGAIFLMGPDDLLMIRDRSMTATRDNVLLELGLFIGKLGRPQCVIVQPQLPNWRCPTDLNGMATIEVAPETFRPSIPVGEADEAAFASNVDRASAQLVEHFVGVETQRWGRIRMDVGYFLRAVRDTYRLRLHALTREEGLLPDFRLNLMTPAADRSLYIACVDYESAFHELEFDKSWAQGEGKCGRAWQQNVQSLYGADLNIAEAGRVEMDEQTTPPTARDLKSVLSTPVLWQDCPVAVLNFDSGAPAKQTLVHDDCIRECFLMASWRVAGLLHGKR